jgi:hypothetical protein
MARVLLVVDDAAEAARLRRVIRAAGYSAELAATAAEAAAAAPRCDLAVVDAACDGGAALSWARGGALPAVALGADPAAAAPLRALPAPADAAALIAALAVAPAPVGAPDVAVAPPLAPDGPLTPALAPDGDPAAPAPAAAERARAGLARSAGAALRAMFGARPRPSARDADAAPVDLAALAAAARERDYFEVLSLPRSASSAEARDAATRLLASLERAAGEPAHDASDLADARQGVLDARDVLGEDGRREAYRSALGGPQQPPADALAPPRTDW